MALFIVFVVFMKVTSDRLKVNVKSNKVKFPGGERGIRTLGTAFGSTHDFQSCSFNQLGHLSRIPLRRIVMNV